MVIMSVDLGLVRTGVAVSDAGEVYAFPRTVIQERRTDRLVEKISDLAAEYQAGLIVVGYPKNMNGSVGERAETCAAISEMIKEASGLETVLWDERCTTISAYTTLNSNNVRGAKRKAAVDAEAACIILQDYLDFRKNTGKL